jgi:hypothetical protein
MTLSENEPAIRCPYCGNWYPRAEIQVEHVIASSWYPKNVPKRFQRIVVPACKYCNSRLGKIEQDILPRLALCLDSENPSVHEIIASLKRACDPTYARNPRDADKREKRRTRLLKDLIDVSDLRPQKLMPFTQVNIEKGSSRGILLPTTFDQIVAKWVRGVHLFSIRSFIPKKYVVWTQLVEDAFSAENFKL